MAKRNLESFLAQKKSLVDGELSKILSTGDKFVSPLYEAMLYSVKAGGKRLRPAIMLLVGEEICGLKPRGGLLKAACSVEMIHTYSLIHDDLPAMDDDDFRRGQPTLHKKYDEATAILAGDSLFSLAIETFLSSKGFNDNDLLAGLKCLMNSVGTGGMVAGQFVDTKNSMYKRDRKTLEYIHTKKTAALIRASFVIPALLCGEESKKTGLLSTLGESAGLLFQIVDDIIDVTQSSKTLGKTAGKDAAQNKLTYVSLYGLAAAKRMAEEEAVKSLETCEKLGFASTVAFELIDYFHKRIK